MKAKFNTSKYHGQELKNCDIVSARCLDDWGNVPVYDDGFGTLFVYMESWGNWMVPAGIVRAMSWEDAFEIARDEFTKEVDWDELDDEEKEAIGQGDCEGYAWTNNGLKHVSYEERLEPIENSGWNFEIKIEAYNAPELQDCILCNEVAQREPACKECEEFVSSLKG